MFTGRSTLPRAAALLFCATIAGCALASRSAPPPPALDDKLFDASVKETIDPKLSDHPAIAVSHEVKRGDAAAGERPQNVLAISGGGIYGAFDVGILKGWTESGKRPSFDVVTGISTGALIAPFAFLGPKYDDFLKQTYLNLTDRQIYRTKPIVSGVFSPSLASSKPLKHKLDAALNEELLEEIAAAHRQGRRLYVGTTNLDTRKLVVWDLGAIAASGKPGSLQLMRDVILASGSVPGFYPPVYIDIDVDGQHYKEMHVDGGAACSVFVRPFMLDAQKGPSGNVYVISSGKLFADAETVKPNLVDIATNAITSLLYASMRSDINSIYALAVQAGMDFHLTSVPDDLPITGDCLSVDPKQMQALFERGYEMGRTQRCWRKKPPDDEFKKENLPRTGVELKVEQ